jgi:hypothetical protein
MDAPTASLACLRLSSTRCQIHREEPSIQVEAEVRTTQAALR